MIHPFGFVVLVLAGTSEGSSLGNGIEEHIKRLHLTAPMDMVTPLRERGASSPRTAASSSEDGNEADTSPAVQDTEYLAKRRTDYEFAVSCYSSYSWDPFKAYQGSAPPKVDCPAGYAQLPTCDNACLIKELARLEQAREGHEPLSSEEEALLEMAEESANPPAGGQFRHSSPWAKYNSLSEEGHGSFGPAPETCVKDPGVRDEAGGFERAPLCWHVATMQCFGAPKTTLLDGRGNEWEALFPLGLVDRITPFRNQRSSRAVVYRAKLHKGLGSTEPGGLDYWQRQAPIYAAGHFKDNDFGFNIFVSGQQLVVALDPKEGATWPASEGAVEFESRFDSHYRDRRVFLDRLEKAVFSSSVSVAEQARKFKKGVLKDKEEQRILKPKSQNSADSLTYLTGFYEGEQDQEAPTTLWTLTSVKTKSIRDIRVWMDQLGAADVKQMLDEIPGMWENEFARAPAPAPADPKNVPFFLRPWGYFLFLLYLWKTRRGGDVLFVGHSMGGAFALGLAARGTDFFRLLAERERAAPLSEAKFLESAPLPLEDEDSELYWIRSLSFGVVFAVCAADQYGWKNPNEEANLWLQKYLKPSGRANVVIWGNPRSGIFDTMETCNIEAFRDPSNTAVRELLEQPDVRILLPAGVGNLVRWSRIQEFGGKAEWLEELPAGHMMIDEELDEKGRPVLKDLAHQYRNQVVHLWKNVFDPRIKVDASDLAKRERLFQEWRDEGILRPEDDPTHEPGRQMPRGQYVPSLVAALAGLESRLSEARP